jgi:hypothetical protein
MLIYADDLIEKTFKVKNQIRHIKPRSDGLSTAVHYDDGRLKDERFK